MLFGTRPELIKLIPIIEHLQAEPRVKLVTASTSQHREMIDDLLELFSLRPDHDLGVIQPNQSLVDISVRAMRGVDAILRESVPDILLVQGDTTSAMAGALTAFSHQVPVGHVEAGLRSFDNRHPFPEEANRRLLSVVADLHFAPLPGNEQNLLREGIDPEKILVTGNTVIDTLYQIRDQNRNTLARYLAPALFEDHRIVLVTAHRREGFREHLAALCHALLTLLDKHRDIAIVYPMHLNPNVRQVVSPILGQHARVHLLEPLPYGAFVEAMSRAHLIITDSGGIQEEAPALGKPVLVYRKVTERIEGESHGSVRLVGLNPATLLDEATRLLSDDNAYDQMTRKRDLYGDGQASRRIVQGIMHHFGRADRPAPFAPQQAHQSSDERHQPASS